MNVKRTECDMCHGTLNPEDNADVGVYIDFEGDGGYSIIGDAEDYRVHFCVPCCRVLLGVLRGYAEEARDHDGDESVSKGSNYE